MHLVYIKAGGLQVRDAFTDGRQHADWEVAATGNPALYSSRSPRGVREALQRIHPAVV